MFSGKTEEMIRRLKRYSIAGKSVRAYKPDIDTRYNPLAIVSHSGAEFFATPIGTEGKRVSGSWDDLSSNIQYAEEIPFDMNADIFAFDEAQFMGQIIVTAVQFLLDQDKTVIVGGLDKDFRGVPFGHMPHLLAIADYVTKLTAICVKCGAEASMTQRLIDGEPAKWDSPTVLVGGLDSYEARCRQCHELGTDS